jgi:hypothetical protein
VFMVDLRMINMSYECEYDWYWKISACSTEYEVCDHKHGYIYICIFVGKITWFKIFKICFPKTVVHK